MDLMDTARDKLKNNFGYNSFFAPQEEILKSIFAGEDVIGILPTGGGKSLCYQIPALCYSDLVLVVSPLISLMKDQVDKLTAKGIEAAYINSSLNNKKKEQVLENLKQGKYDILYVAPERFTSDDFLEILNQIDISLLAIDEIHCVSEWGHNFRPDYLKLAQVKEKLGNPKLLGLTATATPDVKKDIVDKLDLINYQEVIAGFKRNNLELKVYKAINDCDKKEKLKKLIDQEDTPAIIYVGTRNNVAEITDFLADYSVIGYHGGMSSKQRQEAQELFMTGDKDIVVATKAFGMGIDKENVRLVVHYDLPANLEEYYQQAGRAGRDGKKSKCILFYCEEDKELIEFFIESNNPSKDAIIEVCEWLAKKYQTIISVNFGSVARQLSDEVTKYNLRAIFNTLVKANYLERQGRGGYNQSYKLVKDIDLSNLEINFNKLANLKKSKYTKLAKLEEYATANSCRHQFILDYFGAQERLEECPSCDNCNGQGEEADSVSKREKLLARLEDLRDELAQQEDCPEFIIARDSVLKQMAVKMPTTRKEMLQIKGMNFNKYKKYGKLFVENIKEFITI